MAIKLTGTEVRAHLNKERPGRSEQVDEYVDEAEHQDGDEVWDDLYKSSLDGVVEDFDLYWKEAAKLQGAPSEGGRLRATIAPIGERAIVEPDSTIIMEANAATVLAYVQGFMVSLALIDEDDCPEAYEDLHRTPPDRDALERLFSEFCADERSLTIEVLP